MILYQKGLSPFLLKVIGLLILVSLTQCALPSPRQTPLEAKLSPIAVPEDETRSKKLGKEFLVEARKQFVFVKDPEVTQAVNEIGRSILSANGEDPQSFHFLVVKNSVPNAFAVPGGYIFVFDGLLSRMNNVDELAGVLSHEIGHVVKDHFFQENKGATLATLAGIVAALLTREPGAAIAGAATAESLNLSFSREHEREADSVGLRFLKHAGYDQEGLYHFFKTLQNYEKYNPSFVPAYFSTHPAVEEREVAMQMLVRGLPPPPANAKPVSLDWDRIRALVDMENRLVKSPTDFFLDPFKKEIPEEKKHYLTGLFLLNNGQLQEAVLEFNKALETGAKKSLYHSGIAFAYFKLNQIGRAKEEANRSLLLDPANGEGERVLGFIAEAEGDKAGALTHYQKVKNLLPGDAMIYYKLGGLYASMGNKKEAMWHLARYYRYGYQIEKALMELENTRETFAGDRPFRQRVEEEMADILREGL